MDRHVVDTAVPLRAPVPAGTNLPAHLRLLSGLFADAVAMCAAGRATRDHIDLAMRLGAGHPDGPFAVLDRIDPTARACFGPVPNPSAAQAAGEGGTPAWSGPVGVIGTGHMASGIVEAVTRSGRPARVIARSARSADRLRQTVRASLARSVAKGRLRGEAADTAFSAIEVFTDPLALAGVDVVVEAVAEDLEVKREVFARLDAALPAGLPLATNTSSFRVADIAAAVSAGRPVLALHFFNPAQVMKLVEVVTLPGAPEPEGLAADASAWTRAIGKVPVRCADRRGFIVNRLLIPYLNDAVRAHEQGADVAAIDALMTAEAGHPMGPLALIDLIGLDITAAALASMAEAEDDPRLVPADTLQRLVQQGRTGRKSGAGFYEYGERR
jgi:3-hydroxybutyryl-CoA dehydrogenase